MIGALGRRAPYYGWLIVLVTFVTLITTAGFRATPGVLIVPLQDEFGWSRGTISLAISLGLVMFGLASPFSAALMERFGVRKVMLVALATIATGASLTTVMTSSWQLFVLWGFVVGGATGAVAVPLAATVATRWFEEKRGLVTGILTAANASGQMIFLPALAWLATAYGWRWAAVAVAAVAMLLVFPMVAVVVRDRPQSIGLQPYGATEPVPVPPRSKQPFRPAIDGLLPRAQVAHLLAPLEHLLHLRPLDERPRRHAPDPGRDRPQHDRRRRRVAARADGPLRRDRHHLLGLPHRPARPAPPARVVLRPARARGDRAALAFGSSWALVAFAVFYGLDWVATVPPTVALTADTFGTERVGVVFGWIFAAHQFGAAFAVWVAGVSRQWTGTYNYAFVSAGVLCLLAAALSLRIPSPGRLRGRLVAEPSAA